MDAATLAAALDRFAASMDNLAEQVRQEGEATRAIMERVLEAVTRTGPSPVADALRDMGARLDGMQTSLDANTGQIGEMVPHVQQIAEMIRKRNGG
jgi:methyl-accepting chemotaxis protein